MDSGIGFFGLLASLGALCVLAGLFVASCWKFFSVVVGTLAYPAYLAVYGVELVFARRGVLVMRVLSFNLPGCGWRRTTCNVLGALVTTSLVYPLAKAAMMSFDSPAGYAGFVLSAMDGQVVPPAYLAPALACLGGMYIISLFSQVDERHPTTKIERLSVPSLWKSLPGE